MADASQGLGGAGYRTISGCSFTSVVVNRSLTVAKSVGKLFQDVKLPA